MDDEQREKTLRENLTKIDLARAQSEEFEKKILKNEHKKTKYLMQLISNLYSENPLSDMNPHKEWISLTDEDRQRAFESLPDMLDGFLKTWGWIHFAKAIENICKEKNGNNFIQLKPIPTSERLPTEEDGRNVWVWPECGIGNWAKFPVKHFKQNAHFFSYWLPLSAIPEPE